MKHKNDILAELKKGLDTIHQSIEDISNMPVEVEQPLNNSISGDKIHGGRITKFSSVGIQDDAKKLVVLVNDNGLHVDNLTTKTLTGDTSLNGNLTVEGKITAQKLHVDEITADIRNERTGPLEFVADEKGLYGKGLQWKGDGPTKQFTYRANPDRIWSSESIDIHEDASYNIGNTSVLTKHSLGSSIRNSELTKVGTLQNLRTQGNLVIDDYVFYNSDAMRLGFGTEEPNASISIANLDSEFIVDVEDVKTRIGNWTTSDLEIVTDNTARITVSANGHIHLGRKGRSDARVSVFGHLGIGINNVADDVQLAVAGPIKFQDKKFEVASQIPTTGNYRKGDVVWNDNPQPTGYMGWVCIREGTPGDWKPFGQIASS